MAVATSGGDVPGRGPRTANARDRGPDATPTASNPKSGTEVVAFEVRGRTWALPLDCVDFVHEIAEFANVPSGSPVVVGIANVRGQTVPVFDLAARLDGRSGDYDLTAKLIIGHTATRPFAVLAEHVGGVLELPGEALSNLAQLVPGAVHLAGIAPSGEGLIYLQDPDTILTSTEAADLDAALQSVT